MARVLLVEDEWLIAEDHAMALRNAGHEVMGPVRGTREALALISDAMPDLALLDIRLDHETSFPVATELSERRVPFAFVTGLGRTDVLEEFRDAPLLSKPVTPEQLLSLIADLRPSG